MSEHICRFPFRTDLGVVRVELWICPECHRGWVIDQLSPSRNIVYGANPAVYPEADVPEGGQG